jgi:hypothetical protein
MKASGNQNRVKKLLLYTGKELIFLYESVRDISDDPHIGLQITYKMINIKDVSKFPAESI